MTKKKKLNLDELISKLAGFGVPILVFLVACGATGLFGAAAMTTVLAALGGPVGMIGGVAVLSVSGLVIEAITQFGFDTVFKRVVLELYKKGETKESILEKINSYKISENLKAKLRDSIESVS